MIMRRSEAIEELLTDDKVLNGIMLDMVDLMIADCQKGIDGDKICPVCGSIVIDGTCEDIGENGCRWTTESE